jgi:hypothetical protein
MSADRLGDILGELGRGDEIAVAERLKSEAVALAAVLDDLPGDDRQLTSERVQELLTATSSAGESFLTVALPVVEYAERAALETLPRALRQVTLVTAAAAGTDQTARRIAAVPAIGRLVWALAAFALHCDRPEALVTLARARIHVPPNNEVESVIALTALRHPLAFEENARAAFRDYHDWFSQLAVLEQYPLFRADLDAALLEADLVLALCTSRVRNRIYSSGRARDTVRRFVARVDDAAQRQALEELFPGDGELQERLERAYAAAEGDGNRFERGPATLFGED